MGGGEKGGGSISAFFFYLEGSIFTDQKGMMYLADQVLALVMLTFK